ncbi:MAG: HlyD family secretion protein [Puniceicoccaceae bacterium]
MESGSTQKTGWLWFLFFAGLLLVSAGLLFLETEVTTRGTGTVHAVKEQVIFAPQDARLAFLKAYPGDRVKAGDFLIELEDRELEMTLLAELERREIAIRRKRLAELKSRELAMGGGSAGKFRYAEEVASLDEEALQIYTEIEALIAGTVAEGGVSRLQALLRKVDALRAKRETFDSRLAAELKNAGFEELEAEVAAVELASATAEIELIEERIAKLRASLDELLVRAPFDGTLADVYIRRRGMKVEKGAPLGLIVNQDNGYRVKSRIGNRNIDLVRAGQEVRIVPKVYQPTTEGYTYGTVESVIKESYLRRDPEERYDVLISIDRYPVEPVLGSEVEVRIIMARAGLLERILGLAERRTAREERRGLGMEREVLQ